MAAAEEELIVLQAVFVTILATTLAVLVMEVIVALVLEILVVVISITVNSRGVMLNMKLGWWCSNTEADI